MDADYGARILAGGLIAAPANNAYDFASLDFSVTILFETTQPGTLVSCKSSQGEQHGAGWLVVLQPGGLIKFATDNGWGYYQIVSSATNALDGTWHSVAAVRLNGQLLLYLDGQPLAAQASGSSATPVGVSNNQRLTIGGTDQQSEPYGQFVGIVEDVTLWNRGLAAGEIARTMFNKVTPQDDGLVGLWEMNQSFGDRSPTANDAASSGPVAFAPVMHCLWAEAANSYSYLAIDMHADSDFGAQIGPGGLIAIPSSPAYQFGTGDFAVACQFAATSGGVLVASKSPSGGSSTEAGWLVVLNNDGSLSFATDNGWGYCLITSAATGACDGAAHAVAAVRSGGQMSLWLDGVQLQATAQATQTPPLNVSSNRRIVIGQSDQPPTRQFVGVIEDVMLWNRGITPAEIRAARFNAVDPSTPGLVGCWMMDQDLTDATLAQNLGTASGAVSFVDMTSDVGAKIGAGGAIAIPANAAYQFGTGDFSVACLFNSSSGGALVSSKSPSGGSGAYAGWLLILNGDGSLAFVTDNGWGYYLVNSAATNALDGNWHAVAAVRQGAGISLWLDGVQLQAAAQATQTPPLNVSSNLRVLIGQADQPPLRQFLGIIEDVTLWNRAMTPAEVQAARFNAIDPGTSGLVGFWKMDRDFSDASTIGNVAAPIGAVSFVPVAHQAQRSQKLAVAAGTAYLYGGLLDTSQQSVQFPAGALLSVVRPDGTALNQTVSQDGLVVQMNGASVWIFCVANPMAGDWIFTLQAPAGAPIMVNVQTTPSADIPVTIQTALTPLYSGGDLARRYPRHFAVAGLDISWSLVFAVAGVALLVVAAAVIAPVVAGSAALTVGTLKACAAAAGAGAVLISVAIQLSSTTTIEQGSFQVSSAIGLHGPTFGGTGQGNVQFLLDGQNYFAALRDLLLAVRFGRFDAAITLPANPNFKSLLTAIGATGKKVSLLLWDSNDMEHMAENNYSVWRAIRAQVKPGYDGNKITRDAFKGVANVDARLESYRLFNSSRWMSSQHQKMAIVRVRGQKLALVGGLNLQSGYWDRPDHSFTLSDLPDRKPWHDAAVLVQGPAVELIEAEFDRRWGKVGGQPSGPGDYAKVAFWAATATMCLDDKDVCSKGTASTLPYQNRSNSGPRYPVDVLITNNEFAQRVTQVRDTLIARIQAATSWAYFENFTFHDILLTKALIAKLAGTPGFNLVVMLPYPKEQMSWTSSAGYALARATLSALMLSGSEWTQMGYKNAQGTITTVRRADCSGTPTVDLPDGMPVELGTFSYVLAADGSPHSVGLLNVIAVRQTAGARVIATSPARYVSGIGPQPGQKLAGLDVQFRQVYVHSKVAIFDGNYALVGSANFNARSMANDGECSIGIADPATVAAIRQVVFGHWGVDPATQDWKAVMNAFTTNPTDRMSLVPLTVNVLSIAKTSSREYSLITALVDPSFFF